LSKGVMAKWDWSFLG